MNEQAKLTGYVVLNRERKLLTRKKFWMKDDMTGGWIWSEDEIAQIVKESKEWEIKPAYKKAAYLNKQDGGTVIYGTEEVLS